MSNILALLGICIALIAALVYTRGTRERFTSQRAHDVYARARKLFDENPGAPFTAYNASIPGANAVQYSDVRNLYLNGAMTPQSVERAL